jgi:hypothetical protein
MADAWTVLNVETVMRALPSDLKTLYGSWVEANPMKANRLGELVDEIRRTFRRAVEANPANQLDDNPETVPVTGFRHAINSVMFNLGMEMGAEFSSAVDGLITRADIWLRMVQNGGIPIDTAAGEGAPSYRVPENETWLL